VATGKSRRGLNRVLDADNIGHLFSATRAADETASKPSPLMLEEILADTGIPVSQAVMIGDTSYDMEMAANIDMQRIAVSFGMHEVDVLQQYSPSLVIDRLDQLLQWHGLV
jgi:phosphoglycolate phosphatase